MVVCATNINISVVNDQNHMLMEQKLQLNI